MKITYLLLCFIVQNDWSGALTKTMSFENEETVYICGSGNGKRYHLTENCRGLSNCSAKTLKTTKRQAEKEGKTRCGWEK